MGLVDIDQHTTPTGRGSRRGPSFLTVIIQILSGKRQIELGNLTPTRDLNFVEDTVKGFIKIAKCDNIHGEVVNIGSGREIVIGDLVRLIAGLRSLVKSII